MEYRTCEVVSLSKKEIIYKNVRHKKYRAGVLFSLMLIVPMVVLGFIRYNDTETNSLYESVATLGNPNYLPYVDYTGIIFTDAEAYLNLNEDVALGLPITPIKVEEDKDKLLLTIGENLVVIAPEKGIVSDVGENNGVKYIKILHSKDVETIIENIDVSGVQVGNIVEKGQEIGTAKNDSIISFSIKVNGGAIKNISFKDNVISWEE